MPISTSPPTVCDRLRAAIVASGLTHYRVAQLADTSPEVVTRFVRRERDIRGETLDRLAAAMGLHLVPNPDAPGVHQVGGDVAEAVLEAVEVAENIVPAEPPARKPVRRKAPAAPEPITPELAAAIQAAVDAAMAVRTEPARKGRKADKVKGGAR